MMVRTRFTMTYFKFNFKTKANLLPANKKNIDKKFWKLVICIIIHCLACFIINSLFQQDGDDDSGSGSPQKTIPDTIINNENEMKSSQQESMGDNTLIVEISDALSEKDRVKFTVHTRTTMTVIKLVFPLIPITSSHSFHFSALRNRTFLSFVSMKSLFGCMTALKRTTIMLATLFRQFHLVPILMPHARNFSDQVKARAA